jgi:antitoxin ParD1/3/4
MQWQYLPFYGTIEGSLPHKEDPMRSLNISLPESMRTFVDEQTKRGGYGTASEFLRTLIRDAQKRQAEDRLESMLLEGLDSGKPIEVTPAYWQKKKDRIPKAPRRARHS